MIGSIKFLATGISVYRNYSTKTTKWPQKGYKNRTKNKKNYPKIKWTDEQKYILSQIPSGYSVFITGSAGTGKTVFLKHIIKLLRETYGRSKVFVTASTGVAACAINGQTLHSFAGIGYLTDRETMLARVVSNSRLYRKWSKVEALVIDEISMVDAEFFENLEFIAREVRESNEMWGGIQLIVSGDFFQLPPILDRRYPSCKEFAFEADCWDSTFYLQVELTKIFRQSDPRLIKLLQGIRRGESDPMDLKFLEESCSATEPDPSVVRLYPRIEDVNKINEKRMEELCEEVVIYDAIDDGKDPWKSQLKRVIAPDKLELCEGARVMLIKNVNVWHRLVNGATGTVTGFVEPKDSVTDLTPHNLLPVVKFDSGPELEIEPEEWQVMEGDSVLARRKQVPLMLAWAFSIHKCQGMTLDRLHTDLSRAFGYGMVYVALSRVRSLDGLHLSGFSPSKVKAHPKVLQFYQRFAKEQDKEDEDDGAKKIKDSNSNLLKISDKSSTGGTKYHSSLKEFLLSQKKSK